MIFFIIQFEKLLESHLNTSMRNEKLRIIFFYDCQLMGIRNVRKVNTFRMKRHFLNGYKFLKIN